MPCTKAAGDDELAYQRKASNRSADTMPVNPAKQQTTIQRIALLITPLLILLASHTTRPLIQMDKTNMHFPRGDVTTSGRSQAKGLEQMNEQEGGCLRTVCARVKQTG